MYKIIDLDYIVFLTFLVPWMFETTIKCKNVELQKVFYIKSSQSSSLALILCQYSRSLMKHRCIHMRLHIVPHIGKQIAMTWNLQQGGSILSSKEVWIQHGPPSNFLLTEVPTRPLYLKLTYLGKKLSQVSFTIGETVVNLEICPEEISTDLKYTMSKHSKVVTNDQKS